MTREGKYHWGHFHVQFQGPKTTTTELKQWEIIHVTLDLNYGLNKWRGSDDNILYNVVLEDYKKKKQGIHWTYRKIEIKLWFGTHPLHSHSRKGFFNISSIVWNSNWVHLLPLTFEIIIKLKGPKIKANKISSV